MIITLNQFRQSHFLIMGTLVSFVGAMLLQFRFIEINPISILAQNENKIGIIINEKTYVFDKNNPIIVVVDTGERLSGYFIKNDIKTLSFKGNNGNIFIIKHDKIVSFTEGFFDSSDKKDITDISNDKIVTTVGGACLFVGAVGGIILFKEILSLNKEIKDGGCS